MKDFLSILFCFASLQLSAQQNFIVAGHTDDVVYSDIVPDASFNISFYGQHHSGSSNYFLDLNNDGHADFNLNLSSFGGLGGQYVHTIIYCVDTTNRVAATLDSFTCLPIWDPHDPMPLGNSLAYGDTIDASYQVWANYGILAWSSWNSGFGDCLRGAWLDSVPHYAGLMMPNNGDTIFGWIRLKIISSTIFYLDSAVVFDYASNKGFNIGTGSVTAIEKLKIFPNPAENVLHVSTSEKGDFEIISVLNQRIQSGTFTKGDNNINLHSYEPGIYFLLLHEGGRTSTAKFIKGN